MFKAFKFGVEICVFGLTKEESSTILTSWDNRKDGVDETNCNTVDYVNSQGCDEGYQPNWLQLVEK